MTLIYRETVLFSAVNQDLEPSFRPVGKMRWLSDLGHTRNKAVSRANLG